MIHSLEMGLYPMSDETLITPSPQCLGRYEIVRELGRGAMGIVYEAFDPSIKRRVAIKTARSDAFTNPSQAGEMMTRFIREAQAAGALNHPNIITVYDTGEHENIAFIVMEFIDGGSLHDQFSASRRWDPAEVAELGASLAEALAAAHERGIVHRDIKPANIMLPEIGPAKIADFGIAHTRDSNLTNPGDMVGTPYYMSPEQFQGQKVDARSDLFSLGVVLYEMLTGERPFRGKSVNAVMNECLKNVPAAPQDLNIAVPPVLAHVIMKALEKAPLHRYQNGTAFAAALRESMKDIPNPAITKVTEDDATLVGGVSPGVPTDAMAPTSKNVISTRWKMAAITAFVVVATSAFAAFVLRPDTRASIEPGSTGESNYFGRIQLWAFVISTQECYDATERAGGQAACPDALNPPPHAPVTVTIANIDDLRDTLVIDVTDEASVDLTDRRWGGIRITFELDGYTGPGASEHTATRPGATTTVQARLIRDGIETAGPSYTFQSSNGSTGPGTDRSAYR